jgi:hypothetical protein
MRPEHDDEKAETAHLILLSELREDPETSECDMCRRPMSATRAVSQTCESCATGAGKQIAS